MPLTGMCSWAHNNTITTKRIRKSQRFAISFSLARYFCSPSYKKNCHATKIIWQKQKWKKSNPNNPLFENHLSRFKCMWYIYNENDVFFSSLRCVYCAGVIFSAFSNIIHGKINKTLSNNELNSSGSTKNLRAYVCIQCTWMVNNTMMR